MTEKKVCFSICEKLFIDFKLRLRHDGFTQSSFISAVIDTYLNKPFEFQDMISESTEQGKFGLERRRKTKKAYREGRNNIDSLKELKNSEEIYDFLEREIGEL